MNTTIQDEALEQARKILESIIADGFLYPSSVGEYHMAADTIATALLRAKAEEADRCAVELSEYPFIAIQFVVRRDELRAAADALEGR